MDGKSNTGENFERMYDQQPSGEGILGLLVDYYLLKMPSVQMAINRKERLKKIILSEKIKVGDADLMVLDLASGSSRYSIEAAVQSGGGIRFFCVDKDPFQLMIGRHKAEKLGVSHMFEYRNANVFDCSVFEDVKPDLTISSGLTVYHDDTGLKDHLELVSSNVPRLSKFVVDNQIMNPSANLMEKLAKQDDGNPWALHYRTREVFEEKVRKYFRINNSYVDKVGMIHMVEAVPREK
ncbi:MAG: class I SAM-dependent methyltransferase family protein [Deltaproteobacteria bacterium]|nr:class I SAM-dependent methyltransferase family protein [Deltaproteobacteria bacterium]